MGSCIQSGEVERLNLFNEMNTSNSGRVTYQEYLQFTFLPKYQDIQQLINVEFFGYGTQHTRLLD